MIEKERTFNPTVKGISGLNHYLLNISDECSCDNATCYCASACPTVAELGCQSLFCEGDVCDAGDGEPRETMDGINEINGEITKDLQIIRNSLIFNKEKLEENLGVFQELEKRKADCSEQGTITEREKTETELMLKKSEMDVVVKTHKELGLTGSVPDDLNTYCVVGGRLIDSGDAPREGVTIFNKLWDLEYSERIVCPYEYKIGEIIDKTREEAIKKIINLQILIEKIEELLLEIQKTSEYVSDIGVHNCEADCSCIYNPCYKMCTPYTSFCCLTSHCMCLDCVGGCIEEASPYGGLIKSGDRGKIYESTEKMEELEEEILDLIKEINSNIIEIALPINQRVIITSDTNITGSSDTAVTGENYLATEINTNSETLKIYDDVGQKGDGERKESGWIPFDSLEFENDEIERIKKQVSECFTPVETPTVSDENWIVLNREMALSQYGPLDYKLISNPNPRNLFCCSYSQHSKEQLGVPDFSLPDYNIVPAESFNPLPWSDDDNCIEGYECDSNISLPGEDDYTQYDDASTRLKEQLSCMRERLDTIQMKNEIGLDEDGEEITDPIGDISYITDHLLYEPYKSCSFIIGGECSFDHGTVYGQTRISPHYGGSECNILRKSFAVSFSDTENAKHIIKAAKMCNSSSYITYETVHTPGEEAKKHIQVSISGAYRCGAN
jgi:hypothetical protein